MRAQPISGCISQELCPKIVDIILCTNKTMQLNANKVVNICLSVENIIISSLFTTKCQLIKRYIHNITYNNK